MEDQKSTAKIKGIIMNELFKDVNDKQCVLDLYLLKKTTKVELSKYSLQFLEKCEDQLFKEVDKGKILFFKKYEYEKILNEYLEYEYNGHNLQLNIFNKERMENERKAIANIDKLKWTKKIHSSSNIYSAKCLDGNNIDVSITKATKKKERVYQVLYAGSPVEFVDYDIQELINKIESTKPRIDRTGCVSVLRPRNARHKNDNKQKNIEKKKERKKKFQEIRKEQENITIRFSNKYGVRYWKIQNMEEEYQKNCIYYLEQEKRCSLKECPCTVFLSHCIHKKEFLEKVNTEFQNVPPIKKIVSNKKEIIWNNVMKRCNLKPTVVEEISRKVKNGCIYHKGNKCMNSIGLQTCSLFCEDCICFAEYIGRMENEKKKEDQKKIVGQQSVMQQPFKPKLHKIGVKDFIVRGNVFRCMHKSHQIQNVDVEVKVSLNNGEDKLFQISAGYCRQCNVYFIMESTYQELKRKGIILCRVTDSKTYAKGGFMNGSKLAQESILMQYGYNVSQTVGLSARQRQKILAVMIDNKVLSKSEIISYLDFFIRQHGSRNNMGIAISKWEDDREFVEHYRSGEYTKFGVNAIYRR